HLAHVSLVHSTFFLFSVPTYMLSALASSLSLFNAPAPTVIYTLSLPTLFRSRPSTPASSSQQPPWRLCRCQHWVAPTYIESVFCPWCPAVSCCRPSVQDWVCGQHTQTLFHYSSPACSS